MKEYYLIVAILSMVVFAESGVNDKIPEENVWDRMLNLLIFGFTWPLSLSVTFIYEIIYYARNKINRRDKKDI